jgi:molybdopterin converting factor small subunit
MAVSVYIPTPFRAHTENQARVDLDVPDVKTLLDRLEARYQGLRGLVRNEKGEVHHHVNVYVNSEEIGALRGQDTPLKSGDEISIIPALAGGAPGGDRA